MKIAMIFPGYSSQFVGMGKELYDEHRVIQEYFEEASNCLNMNFVKLCFASSDAELSKFHNAYTALFLVNSAIAMLLHNEGIIPHMVMGYCDGEYAALCTAGSISFPDGLYLLLKYSNFYEELLREKNLVALRITGVSYEQLHEYCTQASTVASIYIAITHDVLDYVVVGEHVAIDYLNELVFTHKDIHIDYQNIGMGAHSALMDGVVAHLKMYLEKVDFRDLKIPLLSQLDGHVVQEGADVKKRLLHAINAPLSFVPMIDKLSEYDIIIEIGNKTPLNKVIKHHYPHKTVIEIKKSADIEALKLALKI